jgi:hypothetical protein
MNNIVATEVYTTINVTPREGTDFQFRWNNSLTVNVYYFLADGTTREFDVVIYGERPTLEEVIADAQQYALDQADLF